MSNKVPAAWRLSAGRVRKCCFPAAPFGVDSSRWFRAAFCALVLLATTASAKAEVTSAGWGSWAQIVGEGDLGFVDPGLKDMRLWLEGQSRWNEDWQHWYQGMARAALGYSLSDRATVWLGYTYLPTQVQGKPSVAQQDLWPAFRYILPTEYGTLMFRTMFETNFIRGDDPRFRPRQMVRFMRPFEFEPRLSLVAWDEFFFDRVEGTGTDVAIDDANGAQGQSPEVVGGFLLRVHVGEGIRLVREEDWAQL